MTYLDVEIRVLKQEQEKGYPVEMRVDGLRHYPRGYLKVGQNPPTPTDAHYADQAYGQELFEWFFADQQLKENWAEIRGTDRPRRIRLFIDADEAELAELHRWPWEALCEPPKDRQPARLLAADPETPFSRYLAVDAAVINPISRLPIRILVVAPRQADFAEKYPKDKNPDMALIDPEAEFQALQTALQPLVDKGTVFPQLLRPPCSLAAITAELSRARAEDKGYHVLHVISHGLYKDEQAFLLLADQANQVKREVDRDIVGLLHQQPHTAEDENTLRLVFLASCGSAQRSTTDAFRGLAPMLVKDGMPAVIAMQGQVDEHTARQFAVKFYEQLLRHGQVDRAANEARQVLVAASLKGSIIPVLFLRMIDGRLMETRASEEQAYLERLVKKYCDLEKEYVPLSGAIMKRSSPVVRISTLLIRPERMDLFEGKEVPESVDDLLKAVPQHHRLVLLGEPGSGKTTTMLRLTYDYALKALTDSRSPLPLLVPLGDYVGPESALEYAQSYFDVELAPSLPAYLSNKQVILLLDELNEMPQKDYPERVGKIQTLLNQFSDAPVVLACGLLDYEEEPELTKLRINPLDADHQLAFLNRLFGDAEKGEDFFWRLADEDVVKLWESWKGAGGTWQQFWSSSEIPVTIHPLLNFDQRNKWNELRQGSRPPLLALGQNPYMLTTLIGLYVQGKGTLPPNRGQLLAACVKTLLDRERRVHDHDPDLWPGARTVQGSLARLAYDMQGAGELGRAVDEERARSHLGDGVQPENVLHLAADANVLDPSGGRVRFVHQLVQEYFAACHLLERFSDGRITDCLELWRVPLRRKELPTGPNAIGKPPKYPQTTGAWEETTILAAELAGTNEIRVSPDEFVSKVLEVNPALAGRSLLEGDVKVSQELTQQMTQRLAEVMFDAGCSVRARVPCGVILGRLGDPRFHDPKLFCLPRDPMFGFIEVPHGLFNMGSDPDTVAYWNQKSGANHPYDDELGHQGPLDIPYQYWMARYPVTNAQFRCFVQDGGYEERRLLHCWTPMGIAWLKGDRWNAEMDRYYQQHYSLWRGHGGYAEYDTYEACRDQLLRPFSGWMRKDMPGKHYWADPAYNAPTQPVVALTWYEAVAFANWLNKRLRKASDTPSQLRKRLNNGYRICLPSEAEWEKAARGGLQIPGSDGELIANSSPIRQWPWNGDWDADKCNTAEGEERVGWISPVGMYRDYASPYGCADMVGNVWEWTRSPDSKYPFRVRPADGTEEAETAPRRVVRGGSFDHPIRNSRCAIRSSDGPFELSRAIGFRVVCAPVAL